MMSLDLQRFKNTLSVPLFLGKTSDLVSPREHGRDSSVQKYSDVILLFSTSIVLDCCCSSVFTSLARFGITVLCSQAIISLPTALYLFIMLIKRKSAFSPELHSKFPKNTSVSLLLFCHFKPKKTQKTQY